MAINRRDFLKATSGGALLLASGATVAEAEVKPLTPGAVGILYDATLCIGCKSCMVNCKKYNTIEEGGALYKPGREIPYDFPGDYPIWDEVTELSDTSLSIIRAYKDGTGLNRNQVEDGFSFVKNHCMHCIEPACASVCPVDALHKDPASGAVIHRRERCIGCRYCQVACPFGIPKFEWGSNNPLIVKCQLCHHRYASGGYSACCEYCPTGASIFGPVEELRAEAKRRLALSYGSTYDFPTQTVDSTHRMPGKVSRYIDRIYGMTEAGGTQYLLLAGVPFDKLGFNPRISDQEYPELTWSYIKKVPVLIAALLAAGAVSYYATRDRNAGKSEE
ncbi:MAG: hydrogenase 2 operon protein HybA [Desulfurivibrionaceae bacterium]|nr:hydrogenase 2 operon protein HybA [Desulfobulbales bacterium]MDT8335729.1 hydrogenase 2 operon protein HybA [Desulfurivibrionaceae bacterium]